MHHQQLPKRARLSWLLLLLPLVLVLLLPLVLVLLLPLVLVLLLPLVLVLLLPLVLPFVLPLVIQANKKKRVVDGHDLYKFNISAKSIHWKRFERVNFGLPNRLMMYNRYACDVSTHFGSSNSFLLFADVSR